MGVENSVEDEIDQLEDDEIEEVTELEGEGEQDPEPTDDEPAEDEDDELVITIGDEEPPAEEEQEQLSAQAPAWVKDLRRERKELAKENRYLKEQIAASQQKTAPAEVEIGTKPSMFDEDIDFDEEKYAAKFEAWTERKRSVEQVAKQKQSEEAAAQEAWDKKLIANKQAAASLKVRDYEEAESVVKDILSGTQQGIIIDAISDPVMQVTMTYALGRNPKKAKELAAITNPVQFTMAIAELKAQLKTTTRKSAPVPDKAVRGSAPVSGSVDKKLAALEAEADKSGDRSKLIAYKRGLKAK
ncbi:MAG: hypothetical protein ACRYGK_03865 [Janthinobacterium lividum]